MMTHRGSRFGRTRVVGSSPFTPSGVYGLGSAAYAPYAPRTGHGYGYNPGDGMTPILHPHAMPHGSPVMRRGWHGLGDDAPVTAPPLATGQPLPWFVLTTDGMSNAINQSSGVSPAQLDALAYRSTALVIALAAASGAGVGALIGRNKKHAAKTGAFIGGGLGAVYTNLSLGAGSGLLKDAALFDVSEAARTQSGTPAIAIASWGLLAAGVASLGYGGYRLYRATKKS